MLNQILPPTTLAPLLLNNLNARFFFLPENGDEARETFLDLLHSPGETWISAFGFTEDDLIQEILVADAAGISVHLLLDHMQATGHAEAPKLRQLASILKHGDITITTAGQSSRVKSAIWHDKAMIVRSTVPGQEDAVWWGSVNFSESGWNQGNIAQLVYSNELAQRLIDQINIHTAWAKEHEPEYTRAIYSPGPSSGATK